MIRTLLEQNKTKQFCMNNYASKIMNAYNVYDLDTWLEIPLNNFKLKNCLFGATNISKK